MTVLRLLGALALVATGAMSLACASNTVQKLDPTTRAFVLAAGTWDEDRDGVVTCQDWKAYASRQFDSADTRADGSLDETEYAGLGGRDSLFTSVPFSYFDGNGDKRISKQELVDRQNPAFPHIDLNNDCKLTVAELTAGQKQRQNTLGREDLMKDNSPN